MGVLSAGPASIDILDGAVPVELVPAIAELEAERDRLQAQVDAALQSAAASAHVAQVLLNRIQAARNYCATVDPTHLDVGQILADIGGLLRLPQPSP